MNPPSQPLFDTNPNADASHNVRAPGGYEWWYFDAQDSASDTQVVVLFMHGFVFHPGYLREYFRFARRPTKHRPPVPADFVCAYCAVYRGGKILSQFITHHPAGEYAADVSDVGVRIGRNTLKRDGSALSLKVAGPPWVLTWRGPKTALDQTLSADLIFEPRLPHAPAERPFLSRSFGSAQHEWVVANPLCTAKGTISLGDGGAIAFDGIGYHDHNYGTGPLGPGVASWFWGRALLDDSAVTFHYAVPSDATLQPESHALIADSKGIIESAVRPEFSTYRRTIWNLKYPTRVEWSGLMTLSDPRVIDSSPFYLRLIYTAQIGARKTTAFCELAYPHRLRWPILGRMIGMSITKV